MMVEMAKEAFDLSDLIVGVVSGGIEAPRQMLAVIKRSDTEVAIRWRHPDTCGLSDCRYHYEDTDVHEDVFALDGDRLMLGGKAYALGMADDPDARPMIEKFARKWGIECPIGAGV